LTPWLAEGLVRLGASAPFGQAARLLAHFTGTAISEATARRLTERAGAAWVQLELAEVACLEADPLGTAETAPRGPTLQQVSVDGVFAPLVGGEWREVKLLAVGTVTHDHAAPPQTTDLSYFARLADHAAFGRQALAELHRRGTATAGTVVAVADGADWIQGFYDLHCPAAVRILDFPHALSHVAQAAQATFGPGTAATSEWVARQAHELKHGDPDRVLAALDALPLAQAAQPAEAPRLRDETRAYLAARRAQIAYADFLAAGYPIGSGCAESAAKAVVQARLCGAGMRWAPAHVDPMLGLRAVGASDRWDAAWPQIVRQFRQRARLDSSARRQARQPLAPPPPAVAATVAPAAPPPPHREDAPPKRIVNGRPTADHPWKRPGPAAPSRRAAPTLPKL
jgi:hypothetical protein